MPEVDKIYYSSSSRILLHMIYYLINQVKHNFLQLYFNSLSSTLAGDDSSASPKAEYMAPHILAMSATPIPRTLALALYGDMSLTQVCITLYCNV